MSKNLNRPSRLTGVVQRPWMIRVVDRTRTLINHVRRAPKPVKQAFLIISAAHILGEIPSLLRDNWPKYWVAEIDPYISPWFHLKVERCWYFKDITEDIERIAAYYSGAKIALRYSVAAFLVFFIFFCYHIIDLGGYLWNFKQSHLIYYDLLWYTIVLNMIALSPSRADNLAKIKALF